MKIQAIGVGDAFSPEIGNSSIVIWDENNRGTLIDCGYAVFHELKKLRIIDKIDSVFITHTHGDHVGSLDTFLYCKRFICKQKVALYGYAFEYLEAMDPRFNDSKDGKEYFIYDAKEVYTFGVHHCPEVYTQAYLNDGIIYSGDTCDNLLNVEYAKEAKVIFHEVTFHDVDVHAKFDDLCKSPEEVKNKTWLYHYHAGEYETKIDLVKKNGFAGLLQQGQIIEI
jgi:ribonuclease BN (tRNA processing enzyme)